MLSVPLAERDVKSLRAAELRRFTPWRRGERVISVGTGLYRWRVLDACELENRSNEKEKKRVRGRLCARVHGCVSPEPRISLQTTKEERKSNRRWGVTSR